MSFPLSNEQQRIVDFPLDPIEVKACAGSGKTKTAVHRLAAIRSKHTAPGIVALLSFSNIAIDTFRKEYAELLRSYPRLGCASGVEIETMDGFITTNVLRPHGHLVMKCETTPYLVEGREGFLSGFNIFDGTRSHPASDIVVECNNAGFHFTIGRGRSAIDSRRAMDALSRLAAIGAYTHSACRYWVLRVLQERPFVLRALARRYPHILIDEAQDIGPEHETLLELLIDQGSKVSLIGDPHQAIYEFAHADGRFLSEYGTRSGVSRFSLTTNYRSLPDLVSIANKLTTQQDRSNRAIQVHRPIAFYIPFRQSERTSALTSFLDLLTAAGISAPNGVVLCRSAEAAVDWGGATESQGVGSVRKFAEAAICRDQKKDLQLAFFHACLALRSLLVAKHAPLIAQVSNPTNASLRQLRRLIWFFVRDPVDGLPSADLIANSEWHSRLVVRTQRLMSRISSELGLEPAANLGQRIANRDLEARPLASRTSPADVAARFRTSTVHKVKGESLEAVLYVAKRAQVRAFLDGPTTEDGRIGYVALTRARDLFALAIEESWLVDLEPRLIELGFKNASIGISPPSVR